MSRGGCGIVELGMVNEADAECDMRRLVASDAGWVYPEIGNAVGKS